MLTLTSLMPLMWLAALPHRTERPPHSGGRAKRRRYTLAEDGWLAARMASCGIDMQWSGRVQGDITHARYTMVSLLNIELGTQWEGLCTPWSPEALALKAYYHHPSDAYTVKVADVFGLQSPRAATGMLDSRGRVCAAEPASPIFAPTGVDMDAVGAEAGTLAGQSVSVQEAVQKWGLPPGTLIVPTCLLSLSP